MTHIQIPCEFMHLCLCLWIKATDEELEKLRCGMAVAFDTVKLIRLWVVSDLLGYFPPPPPSSNYIIVRLIHMKSDGRDNQQDF